MPLSLPEPTPESGDERCLELLHMLSGLLLIGVESLEKLHLKDSVSCTNAWHLGSLFLLLYPAAAGHIESLQNRPRPVF